MFYFYSIEYPSVPHRSPQFNTSLPLLDHTFSAPEIPQFHIKNPSVQHNPLSSTPKTPQFHTKNPSVTHQNPSVTHLKPLSSTHTPQFAYIELFLCGTEGFLVWNWGGRTCWVFGVELRKVELRGFWCGTEESLGLKRCGSSVELMCWTEGSVWNWGVLKLEICN